MKINPFLNSERQLRNSWWILTFFLVLAAFLVPTIILTQKLFIMLSTQLILAFSPANTAVQNAKSLKAEVTRGDAL